MLSVPGKYENTAKLFGGGLIVLGFCAVILGLLSDSFILVWLYMIGLFVYQIMMNAWMIKTHGRTYGE